MRGVRDMRGLPIASAILQKQMIQRTENKTPDIFFFAISALHCTINLTE